MIKIFLLKFDYTGTMLWASEIGTLYLNCSDNKSDKFGLSFTANSENDVPFSVAVSVDGFVYVAGTCFESLNGQIFQGFRHN